jgi:hypothetical protein
LLFSFLKKKVEMESENNRLVDKYDSILSEEDLSSEQFHVSDILLVMEEEGMSPDEIVSVFENVTGLRQTQGALKLVDAYCWMRSYDGFYDDNTFNRKFRGWIKHGLKE